jgi:hypothetical protein
MGKTCADVKKKKEKLPKGSRQAAVTHIQKKHARKAKATLGT